MNKRWLNQSPPPLLKIASLVTARPVRICRQSSTMKIKISKFPLIFKKWSTPLLMRQMSPKKMNKGVSVWRTTRRMSSGWSSRRIRTGTKTRSSRWPNDSRSAWLRSTSGTGRRRESSEMKSENCMILLPAYQIWTFNSANDALLFVYFVIRHSNKEINHLTCFFTIEKKIIYEVFVSYFFR